MKECNAFIIKGNVEAVLDHCVSCVCFLLQSSSESEGGTDVTVRRSGHKVVSIDSESEEDEGQAEVRGEEGRGTHIQHQEVDDEEVIVNCALHGVMCVNSTCLQQAVNSHYSLLKE